MRRHWIWLQPLAVLAALAVFFISLFYADNKYQTPPPYGKSGIISLDEETLSRGTPAFLIDGWLLTDARVTDKPTYIGEFSNLQRGNPFVTPHGRAEYLLPSAMTVHPRLWKWIFRSFLRGMHSIWMISVWQKERGTGESPRC